MEKNTKKALQVVTKVEENTLLDQEGIDTDSDLMKTLIRLDGSEEGVARSQEIIKRIVLSNLENYREDDNKRVSRSVELI